MAGLGADLAYLNVSEIHVFPMQVEKIPNIKSRMVGEQYDWRDVIRVILIRKRLKVRLLIIGPFFARRKHPENTRSVYNSWTDIPRRSRNSKELSRRLLAVITAVLASSGLR